MDVLASVDFSNEDLELFFFSLLFPRNIYLHQNLKNKPSFLAADSLEPCHVLFPLTPTNLLFRRYEPSHVERLPSPPMQAV